MNLAEYKMVELGGVDIKKASDEEILTAIILTLGSAGTRQEALKTALKILQKEPPKEPPEEEPKPEAPPPKKQAPEEPAPGICGTWQMTLVNPPKDCPPDIKVQTWVISEPPKGEYVELKFTINGERPAYFRGEYREFGTGGAHGSLSLHSFVYTLIGIGQNEHLWIYWQREWKGSVIDNTLVATETGTKTRPRSLLTRDEERKLVEEGAKLIDFPIRVYEYQYKGTKK